MKRDWQDSQVLHLEKGKIRLIVATASSTGDEWNVQKARRARHLGLAEIWKSDKASLACYEWFNDSKQPLGRACSQTCPLWQWVIHTKSNDGTVVGCKESPRTLAPNLYSLVKRKKKSVRQDLRNRITCGLEANGEKSQTPLHLRNLFPFGYDSKMSICNQRSQTLSLGDGRRTGNTPSSQHIKSNLPIALSHTRTN